MVLIKSKQQRADSRDSNLQHNEWCTRVTANLFERSPLHPQVHPKQFFFGGGPGTDLPQDTFVKLGA